jgi:hypothetical protein
MIPGNLKLLPFQSLLMSNFFYTSRFPDNAVVTVVQLLARTIPFLIGLLWLNPASSQTPQTDLNQPGSEHNWLGALEGTWEVSLKIPIGNGRIIEGSSSCQATRVMDGRFLRLEYKSMFMGKPLTVVRYMGYDRHREKFVEVHFESTHTDVMFSEGILSADKKKITCLGSHIDVSSGQSVQVQTITTLADPNIFVLEMIYTGQDGQDSKTITLTHRKRL